MPRLTPQEIDAYLAGPHVAHLASIRQDGTPHISPVWYQWENGKVTIISASSAVKTRNIRLNPRVAISVATDEWPYQYVILQGSATIDRSNLRDNVRRIFSRYEGEARGAQEADELMDGRPLVAIIIEVDRILSRKGVEE